MGDIGSVESMQVNVVFEKCQENCADGIDDWL